MIFAYRIDFIVQFSLQIDFFLTFSSIALWLDFYILGKNKTKDWTLDQNAALVIRKKYGL